MLELISPAGSPEGVIAAVQNGADAIYLGFGDYNALRNATNFTYDEFGRALEYCRVRGVKTYLALNALAYDRELPLIAERAKEASKLGVDAIIVQDLGVMRAVKQAAPEIPIHGSTRMSIHNLEGVKMAAAMGMERVALARELSRKKLAYICRNSPIETEVFVHGSLCTSYSGQCYMSAATSSSANRGMCREPCRFAYSTGGRTTSQLLSLKDYCLIDYISDLETIGVTGVVIEGRARRPEYSAIVTGIYSKAIHKRKPPTAEDLRALRSIFSPHGLTDGYYTDRTGAEMFAPREETENDADSTAFSTARKGYLNGEYQRVPVWFAGTIREGKRIRIAVADDRSNSTVMYGPVPEAAFHLELTGAALQTQLHKTGGTPFLCKGVKAKVDPGLAVPVSVFNDMRRNLLAEILEQRKVVPDRAEGKFAPGGHAPGRDVPPVLTISVMKLDQLSDGIEKLCPHTIYIPAMELDFESQLLRGMMDNEDINVAVSLPRVMHDNERKKVSDILTRAMEFGVSDALVGNLGQILFVRGHGMNARGDMGLNVCNSEAAYVMRDLGLKSFTLSIEMRLADIRDVAKPLDAEMIIYGRLPVMLTENCIVKSVTDTCTCDSSSGLTDKHGAVYPIVPEFGCRNVLLTPKKVFMADKRPATSALGLWAERLSFTTENAVECVAILKRHMGLGSYSPPGHTRGLYFREMD